MRPVEDGALSGAFVVRYREILRDKYGADALREVLASLPSDVAAAISGSTGTQWIPVDAVESFFESVARRTNRDVVSVHEEFVHVATDQTVKTMWRVLMRLTTDAQLMSQTPVLYRKAWNRGLLTANSVSSTHATMTLSSWPDVPEFTIRGLDIAVTRVLTLAGRKNVRITHQRTGDGAHFEITTDA